jgi:hypothetical protein
MEKSSGVRMIENTSTVASHLSLRRQAFRSEIGEDIRTLFQFNTLKPAENYYNIYQMHDNISIH